MNSVSLASLQTLRENIKKQGLCFTTPTLCGLEQQLQSELPVKIKSLSIKLESMQCTGSFKARGVTAQFLALSSEDRKNKRILVTMSAGNYGKAFAYISSIEKMPAVVCMPESAPEDRREIIKSFGAEVLLCSRSELMETVNNHVREHSSLFFHSFDDPQLIGGHASAGLELVEQLSKEPDVIVVCCGGGGFLAGVALAVRLFGWNTTKIYGVEPDGACTMYEALKHGRLTNVKIRETIAAGLAPPFAGELCYDVVKEHVNGILLVTDEEIKRAMAALYKIGLVAEPSGAAAFAALLSNKIPDCENKDIAVFLTGGNVSSKDLNLLLKSVNNK